MKLKKWVWIAEALALAIVVGLVAFRSSFGFSSMITLDGASYPRRDLYGPPAFVWTRDLSGNLSHLFQSEYSHLLKVTFSVDGRLVAPLIRHGPPEVRCKLFELPQKPEHVNLTHQASPASLFWAAAVCQKKYSKRTIVTQTKDLLGNVFKGTKTPLAHIAGQMFAATQNGLCRITAALGCGPNPKGGKLMFHLFAADDRDTDLFTEEIDVNSIGQEQRVSFEFEPIKDSKFRSFGFYFTSPDCDPGSAPRVLAARNNIEPNGEAWINYRSQPFDLVFKAQYCGAQDEPLPIPFGITLTQLVDVDLRDYDPIRVGEPVYLGGDKRQYSAAYTFPAIADSSTKYYLMLVQINGISVPCGRFLCKHSAGTLLETMRHVVQTLMIDKPPCVKRQHIVILACVLFFLLVVFVNWIGLPYFCAEVPRSGNIANPPSTLHDSSVDRTQAREQPRNSEEVTN
ncbi:MAG TPA: hypothetical protein VM163_06705 [bacterium]|nr:hypothetical protein [bacterium]